MTPPPDRPPLAGPMPRRSGAWSGGGVTRALAIEDLSIVAGSQTLLRPVSFDIRPGEILAIIGPAGSGKTTFLRALNRLIDLDRGLGVSGQVHLNGEPVYGAKADVAHWLYVQAYFETHQKRDLDKKEGRLTIHIPRTNVVNLASMKQFAQYRDTIIRQLKGVVHHG